MQLAIYILVDIKFDFKNATKRELTYNEIYLPIIGKQKIIDPCERSAFQLLEQYIQGGKGPKPYKSTAKAHATLSKAKSFFTNVFRRFSILHKESRLESNKYLFASNF